LGLAEVAASLIHRCRGGYGEGDTTMDHFARHSTPLVRRRRPEQEAVLYRLDGALSWESTEGAFCASTPSPFGSVRAV